MHYEMADPEEYNAIMGHMTSGVLTHETKLRDNFQITDVIQGYVAYEDDEVLGIVFSKRFNNNGVKAYKRIGIQNFTKVEDPAIDEKRKEAEKKKANKAAKKAKLLAELKALEED
jgi:hypothetical protein